MSLDASVAKEKSAVQSVSDQTVDNNSTQDVQLTAAGGAGLKLPLKPRHLQMIAIGGVIGTGLFLGTAGDLKNGGPGGLLMGYCIMASLLYAVMVALGEMVSQFPIPGGQFALAGRFVSPELGFAMGWLYWYNYIVVLPAELICSNAMWVGLMLMVVWAVNWGGTRVFGEMEFWFCTIKVITIVGLIIVGVVITAGGGPNHQAIGFRFWNETGCFVQYSDIPGAKGRFLSFFSVMISAAFAFIGTEITAIAAAETANPRRTVPGAIKSVWIRLVLFYLCSAFIIGLLVSRTDPSLDLASTAAKSPFVIAIQNAGISVLPSIINAALLTSAWSAGCADLYVSSRTLYGLYTRGAAPRFLGKLRKDGLPWACVLVCSAFSLLSFMAAASNGAGTAFGYFANMTAICGMISWACICWTSIRWHQAIKVQGIERNTFAYQAPLQPYLSYYGLFVCLLVIVFGGFTSFIHTFKTSSFITTYFPIPLFAILFLGYKFYHKTGLVPLASIDSVTGCSIDMPEEEFKTHTHTAHVTTEDSTRLLDSMIDQLSPFSYFPVLILLSYSASHLGRGRCCFLDTLPPHEQRANSSSSPSTGHQIKDVVNSLIISKNHSRQE
ncbi:putative arginine permease [Rhexocercosporidium sp. MPI-PUGE-AT-0058]|nr:putative arginine permease [Rhexocercosporidium sp. MPI-PUGE-AT-0058]